MMLDKTVCREYYNKDGTNIHYCFIENIIIILNNFIKEELS